MRHHREVVLVALMLALAAGCTSRTKEVIKEQYVITDVICDRIDQGKQPTKDELYGFVVATRDTFDTLKKKGKSISIAIYSKAVTLSNRIAAKEDIDNDELIQFVKSTRDAYKLLLEDKK